MFLRTKLCFDETLKSLQFYIGFSDEHSLQRLSVKNIRTFHSFHIVLLQVFCVCLNSKKEMYARKSCRFILFSLYQRERVSRNVCLRTILAI